jgi:hypothetical protein
MPGLTIFCTFLTGFCEKPTERNGATNNLGQTKPWRKKMTTLFEAIIPDAQQDLIRDDVIDLVTVNVEVVPYPDPPEHRSTMQIAADVNQRFREEIPWIKTEFIHIHEICSMVVDDISITTKNRLFLAFNNRHKKPIWNLGWTIMMDEDGKMMLDCEEKISAECVDDHTRTQIHKRMWQVNARIGWIIGRLLGEK